MHAQKRYHIQITWDLHTCMRLLTIWKSMVPDTPQWCLNRFKICFEKLTASFWRIWCHRCKVLYMNTAYFGHYSESITIYRNKSERPKPIKLVPPQPYLFMAHNLTTLSTAVLTMMTSSNGKIFRVTGLLWGESLTKASDADLWCFLWCEQEAEQTIEMPVILDAMTHCDVTVMTSSK